MNKIELKDDDFAVPSKRKLRINDERHTVSAWHNVDAAGLTIEEKSQARHRILARASELNIDTSGWHRWRSLNLAAMALNISNDDGHPNKMPFGGILTRLDEPSDAAPGGAHGRKIIVTTAAAQKALPSLLGMAVDFTPSFDDHDAQTKIGIITSANIVGNAIVVEGFIYAADFPETALLIKDLKDVLGFSFEAQRITILDPGADILTVTELAFTGAAILRKDKAAYHSTSLAAAAVAGEIKMTPEELKAILESSLKPLVARLDKVEAVATTAPVDVEAVVKKALDQQAEVAKLAAAQAKAMNDAVAAAVEAATKPLIDKLAAAETLAKDATEKARLEAAAPGRKTISPVVTALLARGDITLPDGDEKLDVRKLDASLAKTNMTTSQRMQLKNELSRAGVLA